MSSIRIRTTHTGSLPRSPELVRRLKEERATGGPRSESLEQQATEEINASVRQQIEAGIDIVGDGEISKEGFFSYITQRIGGFSGEWARPWPQDITAFPQYAASLAARVGDPMAGVPEATSVLSYAGPEAVEEDCDVLIAALEANGHPVGDGFMTAPSPGILASAMRNHHFDSYGAYLDALSHELAHEYRSIVQKGLTLQIDSPDLAMERTIAFQDRPLSEFLDAVEQHVDALNKAIEGLPPERIRVHCCYGNHPAPHVFDVDLAAVLPLITKAKVGAIGVPFASPRHQHEIGLVGELGIPTDMTLVAGVVDVTTPYFEHPRVVSQRLQSVVRAVGDPERVIASPDCGFATFAGMSWLTPDLVWPKLHILREGADLAAEAL